MSTHHKVDLEIDHERGVIYAHLTRGGDILNIGAATVLRIQGLPTPIPHLGRDDDQRGLLDINFHHFDDHVGWTGRS